MQAKFAWSASQVCLEYKPSLLGVQVKFAWSTSQVTLRDKFAWSASQVCLECKSSLLGVQVKFAWNASQVTLRDKPPSLSDLEVKATAFIDLEYTPSHLRPQASSIE